MTTLNSLTTADGNKGRRWAYAGVGLGGVVSIAANVAHSFVPPEGTSAEWSPEPGAVASAVFWPVALFTAVEIFARVAWPAGASWVAIRWIGLMPVAIVAAVVSYQHLSGLLAFYMEDALVSRVGPLAVDGLMVMATGALIATGKTAPTTSTTKSTDVAGVSVLGPLNPLQPPTKQRSGAARSQKQQGHEAAARVRDVFSANPDASNKHIAGLVGVSERTVRRHLASLRQATVAGDQQ